MEERRGEESCRSPKNNEIGKMERRMIEKRIGEEKEKK